MSKVIFISGASRGFGRKWAEALLERGDKVIATARNISMLDNLARVYGSSVLCLQLDVNNRSACFEAVQKAIDRFGQLDVLINNAGYGLFGAVEESTEAEARAQMETNFFGVLWLTQAALPAMRDLQRGHIIQVSSYLGLTTIPLLGLYNASKFAVEGLSETIAREVSSFNIRVTLVEPNGFSTEWAGASAIQTQKEISAYAVLRTRQEGNRHNPDNWGDPEATIAPVLDLIDNPEPPLRLLLGKVAYDTVYTALNDRLKNIRDWREVTIAAHGHLP